MVYIYVLRSKKDDAWYTGWTRDLRKRFKAHQDGRVRATSCRRPLEIVYYEACLSQEDAKRRERYLKTGRGKFCLHKRLASWCRSNKLKRNSLAQAGSNKLERY